MSVEKDYRNQVHNGVGVNGGAVLSRITCKYPKKGSATLADRDGRLYACVCVHILFVDVCGIIFGLNQSYNLQVTDST